MDSIFATLEYREYLRAYYETRKQASRSYSYRQFANAIGMDQSHLAKILIGHLHLPTEKISAVSSYLELEGSAVEYFAALVGFGRATTPSEAHLWFAKLERIRPPQYRSLAAHQVRYFTHWYTPVVRALAAALRPATAETIAARLYPAVTSMQVQESLDLLVQMELIKPDGTGFQASEPHLGSGRMPGSPILRDYHRQVLGIATAALEDIAVEERDISSLTVGLDQAAVHDIRSMIREFRLSIQKRIDQVQQVDRVYHINFQMVPVTQEPPPETREERT